MAVPFKRLPAHPTPPPAIESLEPRTLLSGFPLPRPRTPEPVRIPSLGSPAAPAASPGPLDINLLRSAGYVTVSGTPGTWSQIFDGDTGTLNRSENINPAVVQLNFSTPTTFHEFHTYPSHTFGNPAYRWMVETADTQADLDAKSGTYRLAVPWTGTPSDAWSTVALPAPITAKIARLTMQRLTGDNYVHINEWVLIGTTSANVLSTPRGIDVDSTNRTAVAESGASRVAIFDAAGQRVGGFDLPGAPGNSPWDLAFDAADNLFVADTPNHRILKYDQAGNLLAQFGSSGTLPGQFSMPRGIAVEKTSGRIYVADTFNHRVQRFLANGTLDTTWGTGGVAGTTATVKRDHAGFDRPMDVAVNPVTTEIYIADYGNARIEVYNSKGGYVRTYHAVYRANALSFDPAGNLYIAGEDPNNGYTAYDGRLRLLKKGETLISEHYTGGLDDLSRYLGGVAVGPDGRIVVADTLNGRLVRTAADFQPRIFDRRVEARGNAVTFRWKTAVPSPSSVRYGTTTAYGTIVTDPTPTTDHAVTVTGLAPNTRLYYGLSFPDSFDASQRWTPQDVINSGAPAGRHLFLRLKAAATIYTDVQAGAGYRRMTDADVARSRERYHEMAEFYWRNSGFKLWVDVNIIEVNRDITGNSISLFGAMANDLAALGYSAADDFDAIYGSSHLADGNFGGGSGAFGRGVGMAQWGGLDTWVAVHEINHSIDSIYGANDFSKYEFNHGMWAVPNGVGTAFSLNGQIVRNMMPANLTATRAPYTKILNAPDADNDGVPDDTIAGLTNPLPVTEKTLGTSIASADTDGDGISDMAEATALIYHGTNPLAPDSDQDGTPDNLDLNPAYRINDQVGRGSPSINGAIGAAEGWGLLSHRWGFANDYLVDDNNQHQGGVTTYAAWDDNYFYLALKGPATRSTIHLDGEADGWFFGPSNYKLRVDNGSFNRSVSVNVGVPDLFRMIDDDGQYSSYDDTDPGFTRPYNGRAFYNQPAEGAGFPGRLVTESNLLYQRGGTGNSSVWEVAIPWSSVTQFYPELGKLMAINLEVSGDEFFETDHAARLRLVGTANALPPSADAAVANLPNPAGTQHTFIITYSGAPAINASTIDSADMLVTGPGGFSQLATLLSVSGTQATYRIAAPGGQWDAGDWGIYTLTMRPNQVADTGGRFVPAGELAQFIVGQPAYTGTPHQVPGRIQAEDFDHGGEGVAYHDTDPNNISGQYRATGVDIESVGGGYAIAFIQGSEWLEYTVDVPAAGLYDLRISVASAGAGGTLHLESGGVNRTGAITVPNTGSWTAYQTLTRAVQLPAGRQVLRLAFDSNGATGYVANVDWIDIVARLPGDANLDERVDFLDFTILRANFGQSPRAWEQGDFDGDAAVTFLDFQILERNFGRILTAPSSAPPAAPLPPATFSTRRLTRRESIR